MNKRIFYFLIFIFISYNGYCQDPETDSGAYTTQKFDDAVKAAWNDVSTSENTQLESGRPRSQLQTSIRIDKHTQDFRTEYNKGENIIIILRILNGDLSQKLDSITINEELPEGFIIPSKSHNYNTKIVDGIKIITWDLSNQVRFAKYINYSISTNKSGPKYLANSWLKASIKDRSGVTHEITSVSNDLYINIINRDPKIRNTNLKDSIFIKKGEKLSINATFIDPDNDTVDCFLRIDNQESLIPIKKIKGYESEFIWNLPSEYTNKDHIINLEVTDNESEDVIGPFEIKTYYIFPWDLFSASEDLILFGQIILVLLSIFGAISLKNIWPNKESQKILKAEEWNRKGLKFHRLHKYEQAIKAFEKAIKFDSNFSIAYNSKGETKYHLKKYDDAIEAFKKAIEIDSSYTQAINNLGLAYADKDMDGEAINYFQQATDLDPRYAEAWYNLGRVLSKQGRDAEASNAFEKADKLGYKC